MIQAALFLLFVLLVAFGFSWLSDQPGSILINFAGYERLFTPVEFVLLTLVSIGTLFSIWILMQRVISVPAVISRFFKRRREKRGLEALSAGLIAVGIGDRQASTRYATAARKTLPNEPLTALLRAQSAQLTGDRATARRIYEAMLGAPDTELLGLRGLFLEAQHENEDEAAFQFAEQAVTRNPKLQWSVLALFQFQCKRRDWAGALKTLEIARQHGHVERTVAMRRRAVLLTAQAVEAEDGDMDRALELALEAHRIATDLIPAANVAGRILASKGNTAKAAKIVVRTWRLVQHPDLALTYSFARPGDSPKDRLQRMKILRGMAPYSFEGSIAVAHAAIEAKEWDTARVALENLTENNPSSRVCTLMARIEGELGDHGRMREWLAKAVRAPRDPVWVADGYVSDRWLPLSPVTGQLDRFEWKIPVEQIGKDANTEGDELLPLDMIIGTNAKVVDEATVDQSNSIEPQSSFLKEEYTGKPKDEVFVSEGKASQQKENSDTNLLSPNIEPGDKKCTSEGDLLTIVENGDHTQEIGKELIVKLEEPLPQKAQSRQPGQAIQHNPRKSTDEIKTTTLRPKYSQRQHLETKIYVSPHAPDDPGVEPHEEEEKDPVSMIKQKS